MRFILALAAAGLFAGASLAQDANLPPPELNTQAVPGVMARAVDDVIRPGYHAFEDASGRLANDMGVLCAEPFPKNVDAARHAFAATVEAWSKIEIVRVGPVLEDNRFERILFYPDRKSTGLKQVQAALVKKDETATDMQTLKDKSVAMQGLGALEFILYGTGSEDLTGERDSYRCRYGMAVAENLKWLSGELVRAWDDPNGIQKAWKTPGPDNPLFRDEREAVGELLGVLVHAAESVRDQRLETFYKGEGARAFPKQAIYRRSGLTFTSIEDNLKGIGLLLKRSDMAELLDPEVRSIVSSIEFLLKSVERKAGELDRDVKSDVELSVKDNEARAKLDYILLNAKDLILRLNDQYGGAIGLSAGFSFSDGD
ncbi:imelysin family protein [Rhizobium halophytocola]|uniref:Lipoprotein n=1 Tax=Rhizobium halophytocola TaxID=735519 RepID=A0ABS4E0F4_9HYPH|nr:imelysin family protein [Rhizobium halophytocola]MBP1851417.1 putative lipoprotein [Rhizobium halophytocola]